MILLELYIRTFGGLSNRTLSFGPGFNLVFGPNERGKSTVLACLAAMLYGMPGGPRNIRDNLRRRYLPWDGSPARASLTIEQDGRVYRVERTFGKRRSEDALTVTDDRTGTVLELPTCVEPGEWWTGLPAAEFQRSLLSAQQSVPVRDPDGALFSRLANLADTGQEEVSFPEIEDRLRRAMVRLRAERGNGGRINEAERERASVRERYHAAVDLAEQRAVDLDRLESLRREREQVAREREQARALLEQTLKEQAADEEALRTAVDRLHDVQETGKRLKAEYEQIRAARREEEERLDESRPVPEERIRPGSILLLALAAVLLGAGAAGAILIGPEWSAVAVAALVPLVLLSVQRSRRRRSRNPAASPESQSRLTVLTTKETEAARRVREQESERDRSQARLEQLRLRAVGSGTDRLEQLRAEERMGAGKEQHIQEETAYLEAGLRRTGGDANSLEELEQQMASLDAQIQADTERYEGLGRARAAFRAVLEQWQNDLGPRLNARAAQWVSRLTDGAYTDLRADRELALRLASGADRTFRSWEYLSGATVDQAYLALRLAFAESMEQGTDLPVLLDDPLSQYDDPRARSAIRALRDRPGQTVLFTCQERMAGYAGNPEDTGYTLLQM